MAQFLDLPREVVLLIYEKLESLTGIYCLAFSCKWLYELVSSEHDWQRVIKSIVKHSSIHEYDAKLSHFMEASSNITITPRSTFPTLFRRCFYAKADDLDSNHIADILSRWRAISGVYKAAQGAVCARAMVMMLRDQRTSKAGEDYIELSGFMEDACKQCRTLLHGPRHGPDLGLADFYERSTAIWLEIVVTELMGKVNSFDKS